MQIKNFMHFVRWGAVTSLGVAMALSSAALAQNKPAPNADPTGVKAQAQRMAALNAQASKLDPEDYKFVQPVCTVCHSPEYFLHSRTWPIWQGVFDQMSGYGAVATKEQWSHIYQYFQKTMTDIDVNHADEDQLTAILGVDMKTAILMVQRRPFASLGAMEKVPGVNKAKIELMKDRVLFDTPPDEQ